MNSRNTKPRPFEVLLVSLPFSPLLMPIIGLEPGVWHVAATATCACPAKDFTQDLLQPVVYEEGCVSPDLREVHHMRWQETRMLSARLAY